MKKPTPVRICDDYGYIVIDHFVCWMLGCDLSLKMSPKNIKILRARTIGIEIDGQLHVDTSAFYRTADKMVKLGMAIPLNEITHPFYKQALEAYESTAFAKSPL